jgi:hypothetical protein
MSGFMQASGVACFIGIVIAIVDALSPSDKFAKQLKMMFALVFMLCVVTPIASGEITFDDGLADVYAESTIETAVQNTDDYIKRSVERNLSRNLTEVLRENGITVKNIETSINISDSGSIDITVIDLTLDPRSAQAAVDVLSDSLAEEFTVNIYDGT